MGRFEEVLTLKPHEVSDWVEENISLTAPVHNAKMRFIYNPEKGWNQIRTPEFESFTEMIKSCNHSGVLSPLKTGLCQADSINYKIMSQTEPTEFIYRFLAYHGRVMDDGFGKEINSIWEILLEAIN